MAGLFDAVLVAGDERIMILSGGCIHQKTSLFKSTRQFADLTRWQGLLSALQPEVSLLMDMLVRCRCFCHIT